MTHIPSGMPQQPNMGAARESQERARIYLYICVQRVAAHFPFDGMLRTALERTPLPRLL